ncbi:RICIN domain-containing protein [Actinoplanes sp. NPDC049548]|uniref:RICIN domain-containing protein n=1 Tax=Actinoplanes sp. NPDC049548 TaxID=3155152 RepID=UPI00341820C4
MAETPDERQDPVLVRPYIRTEPGGTPAGHDDRPEETWPEPAGPPGDEHAGTGMNVQATLPDEAQERTSALRRQRLIVLSGVAVLALVGAGLVVAGSRDGHERRTLPEQALPATGSLGGSPAPSHAARPSASSIPGTRATSHTRARTATTTAAASTGAPKPAPPAPTAAPPSATLAPPPAADRTGAITSAAGRCLTLGGLLGLDGSPIQVAGCGGGSAQSFTLATDGTLRVAGRCAQLTGDGEVRTIGCDGRENAQWRAGPGGSLVNPATGHCLTDPGSAGATVRAEACTGAAEQRWTLP